jgi:hypothetical protein
VVSSAPAGKGIKLHIEDGFGRTSDRYVAEANTAVSLIESWIVDDKSDLLAVPPVPAPPAATVVAAPPPAVVSPLQMYAAPLALVGSDSSLFMGGMVGGCGQVGLACLGAEIGFVHDTGAIGETPDAGTSRNAANVLVTAGVPIRRGAFFLMPAIGAGVGWMRTHVAAEDMTMPAVIGTTFGFRGQLSAMAGAAVSSHIGLALDVAILVAPGARPAPPDESMSSTSQLPAEPAASLGGGLALVVMP